MTDPHATLEEAAPWALRDVPLSRSKALSAMTRAAWPGDVSGLCPQVVMLKNPKRCPGCAPGYGTGRLCPHHLTASNPMAEMEAVRLASGWTYAKPCGCARHRDFPNFRRFPCKGLTHV